MGYKNRVVQLDFPDISEDDDPIWVKIRNPKLLPGDYFDDVMVTFPPDPPEDAPEDVKAADRRQTAQLINQFTRGSVAKLVVGWNAYDATDDSDEPAKLPLPVTQDLVGKLPPEIIEKIMEVLREARNPQSSQGQSSTTPG